MGGSAKGRNSASNWSKALAMGATVGAAARTFVLRPEGDERFDAARFGELFSSKQRRRGESGGAEDALWAEPPLHTLRPQPFDQTGEPFGDAGPGGELLGGG